MQVLTLLTVGGLSKVSRSDASTVVHKSNQLLYTFNSNKLLSYMRSDYLPDTGTRTQRVRIPD